MPIYVQLKLIWRDFNVLYAVLNSFNSPKKPCFYFNCDAKVGIFVLFPHQNGIYLT